MNQQEEMEDDLGKLLNQAKEAIAKACITPPPLPSDGNDVVVDNENETEFSEIPPIIAASDFDETYEISLCPETDRPIIEYLDLSEFEIRYTPEEVFEFYMLQSLHFSRCHALQEVSPSIRKLKGLTQLDLSRCTSQTRLPDEIFVSLTQLNRLTLAYCTNLEELPN